MRRERGTEMRSRSNSLGSRHVPYNMGQCSEKPVPGAAHVDSCFRTLFVKILHYASVNRETKKVEETEVLGSAA